MAEGNSKRCVALGARLAVRLIALGLVAHALGCNRPHPSDLPRFERRLYVAHKSRVTVYAIDRDYKRIARIPLPITGGFMGIGASVALGRLYVTSNLNDELIALDLVSEQIVWRKKYCAYLDSFDLTPDGRTLYLPCRHAGQWVVVDADSGREVSRIETGRGQPYAVDPIKDYGPHNTVVSADGRHVYLATMTIPYVFVVDTATQQIVSKVGPFSRGVRPLAVSEPYLFANVDGLLGFEVADLRTGAMIDRVEARTPPERAAQIKDPTAHHHTPSHGVAVRPGGREVWVSDDVNGYVHVFDVTTMPPRQVASVPLFKHPEHQPRPAWITFSLDGHFAVLSCNAIVDADARKVVARVDTSERVVEIDFKDGRPVRSGKR
jgi:DNA-binding beta-propeller fold protein YncE